MKQAAVIGLGDIAPSHLEAIQADEGICLAAVCDLDPTRAQAAPGTRFYTDYHEMFRREQIDCVHICLPHHLHYPVAREAAAAGLHIFAEKPLAMNAGEGLLYTRLEEEFGVRICICLQNRRNTTTEVLLEQLRSGRYGRIVGVRGDVSWYRDPLYYSSKPWRARYETAGGGCMINQSIHTLDLMQYLAGQPVRSIRGSIAQLLDYPGVEVEDTAAASILFEGGARGYFTASVANYENQGVRLRVRCEQADFLIDTGRLYRLDGDSPQLLAEDAVPRVGKAYYGSSHAKLIGQFYEVLEQGNGAYIHPQDALVSLQMIDAIRESSLSGRTILL